ncbi:MAG: ATP-binding protein [Clostridia bacterium]|nr:ATP-binding protein [Clostridia bacterium]
MNAKEFESITALAKAENVTEITDFIDKRLASHNLPKKLESAVHIIIDEVFSNIVQYSSSEKATVSCSVTKDNVIIRFEDNGIPYNPLSSAAPDTTLNASERDIGGLGILMVKKMSDKIEYEYADEKNILTVAILRRKES